MRQPRLWSDDPLRLKPFIMDLAHKACVWTWAIFMLRYSAGPGPITLEPGALKQVEQRHSGLTHIHVGLVNVPFRQKGYWSVTFLRTERVESNLESREMYSVVCLHAGLYLIIID